MKGLRLATRTKALIAAALVASLAPGAALAQTASGAAARPVSLRIELPPGSPVDAARLRDAVGRELGAPVVEAPGAPGGTLVVRLEGATATVSFDGPGGRHDTRALALPADAARAELDVALVAVNVARDQASAFLPLPEPPAPAPVAPPPPPAAPPPLPASPCARLAMSRAPRASVGADFVPYAGTSSFDAGRSVRRFSLGALGAVSSGVDGVAVGGLLSLDAGPVCGVAVAGLVDTSRGAQGVAVGGLVSVAAGPVSGVQVGGLASVAESVDGVALGGLVGVASGPVSGLEVSGLASYAGRFDGAQVGGLTSVASGDSEGLQLSLVNVAGGRMHGLELGLVNVADDADVQLGLVNIDRRGFLRADAWTRPESATVLAGIEHGSRSFHSIYALEANVVSGRPWAVFGLGPRLAGGKLRVDLDFLEHVELVPTSTNPNMLTETRLVFGLELAPHLSAFAGPTFNVLVASDLSRADAPSFAATLTHSSPTAVAVWPGVVAGVEAL